MHTEKSYDSLNWNNLYYCFIKPYEGLCFRLIGISDEEDNALKVDEDKTEIEDIPYSEFKSETISKIVENGDLISNQLIVDIPYMLGWGVVAAGDVLVASDTEEEATLQADGQVQLASGEIKSIQQWLKDVYGWSSVETYKFSVLKRTGRTLSEIRREYMEQE